MTAYALIRDGRAIVFNFELDIGNPLNLESSTLPLTGISVVAGDSVTDFEASLVGGC